MDEKDINVLVTYQDVYDFIYRDAELEQSGNRQEQFQRAQTFLIKLLDMEEEGELANFATAWLDLQEEYNWFGSRPDGHARDTNHSLNLKHSEVLAERYGGKEKLREMVETQPLEDYQDVIIETASKLGRMLMGGGRLESKTQDVGQFIVGMAPPENQPARTINWQRIEGQETDLEDTKSILRQAAGLQESDVQGWTFDDWMALGSRFENMRGVKLMGENGDLTSLRENIKNTMEKGDVVFVRDEVGLCRSVEMEFQPIEVPVVKNLGAKRFANWFGKLFNQSWYQEELEAYDRVVEYNSKMSSVQKVYKEKSDRLYEGAQIDQAPWNLQLPKEKWAIAFHEKQKAAASQLPDRVPMDQKVLWPTAKKFTREKTVVSTELSTSKQAAELS